MTLEDLLSRLIPGLEQWAKLGESNRQLQDAGGILRTQGDKLDLPYVERWVRDLRVEEQWKAVREKFL